MRAKHINLNSVVWSFFLPRNVHMSVHTQALTLWKVILVIWKATNGLNYS